MNQELLSQIILFTNKLIHIPSTADNSEALHAVIKLAKEVLNGFSLEEFESNGKPSLLVKNTDKLTKEFKIILNAHLDVVPGSPSQFVPYEKDGKLFGRGTLDTKAAAAVMILLFKHVGRIIKYPLALQLVTDEEIGGFQGTLFQVKKGYRGDFIIAAEHTNLNIKNTAKGMVMINITTRGQAGHSAYPWLVDNAIAKMYEIIHIIQEKYPKPQEEVWATTASFINIHAGNPALLTAKIPDVCTMRVDFRVIPGEKQFLDKIKKLLPADTEIEVVTNETSPFISEENQYVALLKEKVKEVTDKTVQIVKGHGTSDLRHFAPVHCTGVEFGPTGLGHHSDNEYVDIKSLEDYYHILKEFLLSAQNL